MAVVILLLLAAGVHQLLERLGLAVRHQYHRPNRSFRRSYHCFRHLARISSLSGSAASLSKEGVRMTCRPPRLGCRITTTIITIVIIADILIITSLASPPPGGRRRAWTQGGRERPRGGRGGGGWVGGGRLGVGARWVRGGCLLLLLMLLFYAILGRGRDGGMRHASMGSNVQGSCLL